MHQYTAPQPRPLHVCCRPPLVYSPRLLSTTIVSCPLSYRKKFQFASCPQVFDNSTYSKPRFNLLVDPRGMSRPPDMDFFSRFAVVMTSIPMKHFVLVVVIIFYARSSFLVILSLTLLFQRGISALYSPSYGALRIDPSILYIYIGCRSTRQLP